MRYFSILFLTFLYSQSFAQGVEPIFQFSDHPVTHNMHICFDGTYYYTVNGSDKEKGHINKFDAEGYWQRSYPLKLDCRSIFYNSKDKSLYVACYDRNIYKLTDMELGGYVLKYKGIYKNANASVSISADGNQLFVMDDGTVNIYDFNDGQLLSSLENIKSGDDNLSGSTAIAVDEKVFYTWDSKNKEVFVYDLNGNYLRSITLENGDYPYSLSFANSMLFAAKDGDGNKGTWYAYDLKEIVSSKYLEPVLSFEDITQTHNMKICSDGDYYYTINGGDKAKGFVKIYSLEGQLLKAYPLKIDMRSIMYSPLNSTFYLNTYSTKDKNIYEITKMKKGKYKTYIEKAYVNPQCGLAINEKGLHFYAFNGGFVDIIDLKSKQSIEKLSGLKSGETPETGSTSCAVDSKYIYTWNSENKILYKYDHTANLIEQFQLSKGDYGFSISYANGYLFVAEDGNNGTGTWYAYKIP